MTNIKDVNIFFEDGMYTADISMDNGFIVTEGKTFDELLRMIDDAIKGYADNNSYQVKRSMPMFTFNFSHNASQLQTH